MLQRRGFLEIWHQSLVAAGDSWQTVAQRYLDDSEIILVLVSAALLASAHPYEQMTRALLRRQRAPVRMIPVLLRPCDWQLSPLWGFQAVPSHGAPVTSVQDRHAAWDEVTQAVWTAVSELRGLSAHRHETPIRINTCLPETKETFPKRPLLLIISFALMALFIVTLKFFTVPPHEPDILKNPSLERFQVELKCPRGSSCRREIHRLEDPVNRELTILVELRDVETGKVLTRMQLSQKQLIAWQTSPSMPLAVREFLRTFEIVPTESYIIIAKPENFPLTSLPAAVVKAAEPQPLNTESAGIVTKVISENTDVQPGTVLVELDAQAKFAKELTDLHERLTFYQKKSTRPRLRPSLISCVTPSRSSPRSSSV
jgi:hypothetical protein